MFRYPQWEPRMGTSGICSFGGIQKKILNSNVQKNNDKRCAMGTMPSGSLSWEKQIPLEAWVYIFDRLSSLDITICRQVCTTFKQAAEDTLIQRRSNRIFFVQNYHTLLRECVAVPVVSPVQGDVVAVCKTFFDSELQIWSISTGEMKAACDLPSNVRYLPPAEITFSNTGAFICLHFEKVALLYTLNLSSNHTRDNGINLLHVFKFGDNDQLPGGDDEWDDICDFEFRMLSVFSENDDVFSICRVERLSAEHSGVYMQFTSFKTNIRNSLDQAKFRIPTSTESFKMNRRIFELTSDLDEMQLNADPFRILLSPNICMPVGSSSHAAHNSKAPFLPLKRLGSGHKANQFSPCGQFLIEVKYEDAASFSQYGEEDRFIVWVNWWNIEADKLFCRFESIESFEVLKAIVSSDSNYTVALLGHHMVRYYRVFGWNVYQRATGETLKVRLAEEECDMWVEDAVSMSNDAELISFVGFRSTFDTCYTVHVYEVATGVKSNMLACQLPSSPGRCTSLSGSVGGTHLVGSGDNLSLTSFNKTEQGLVAFHFNH